MEQKEAYCAPTSLIVVVSEAAVYPARTGHPDNPGARASSQYSKMKRAKSHEYLGESGIA